MKKKANGKKDVLITCRVDSRVREQLHALKWLSRASIKAVITDLVAREHARLSKKEKASKRRVQK